MNPIQKEEIIDFQGTGEALQTLIDKLKEMKTEAGEAIKSVTREAKELVSVLKVPVEPVSPDTTGKVRQLSEEFKSLLRTYGILEEDVTKLTNIQRDQNAILNASKNYVKAAGDAYNNMSAEYTALKAIMNTLNPAIEDQAELLQKLTVRTNNLYSAMNEYQKKTGRYQLQVGNYSKAFDGLALSMNQVVREVPTLQNSLNQFAVAISNNIPILADNARRFAQDFVNRNMKGELDALVASGLSADQAAIKLATSGKALNATIKAIGKTLVSWNTLLVVAITAVEFITKAIDKKRRAQKEANGATKEALTLEGLLTKAYYNEQKQIIGKTSELKTLYAVMRDENRVDSDRIAASKEISRLAGIEIQDYKNKSEAVENYIKRLELEAKARAVLSEITDAYVKISEEEEKKKKIETSDKYIKALAKEREAAENLNSFYKVYGDPSSGYYGSTASEKKLQENVVKAKENVEKLFKAQDDEIEKQENFIKNKVAELNAELIGAITGSGSGGKGKKDSLKDIRDYTFDLWQERIDGMKEGADREVEELRLANARNIEELRQNTEELNKELEKAQKTGNTKRVEDIQKQLELLRAIASQQVENIAKNLLDIQNKYIEESRKGLKDYITEVENLSVDEAPVYTQVQLDVINSTKEVSESLYEFQKAVESQDYSKAVKTGKSYNKALRDLAEATAAQKKEELGLKLDLGLIDKNEFDKAVLNVDMELSKSLRRLSGKKGKKLSIWDMLFGDVKADDAGNVTKELSAAQNAFLDQVKGGFQTAISYAQEYIQALTDIAEKEVEAARAKTEAAKEAYDYEREARANGYANSVETARREYEEKLKIEQEAMKKKEELAKAQERINTITQVSSLIAATAQLWAAHASIPIAGPILAAAATAAMWGSFLASKIKAQQLATYGDGMSEYIDYGDSHASGHDVDFGVDNRGRRRRVERGEVIGVVNKKNVRKFGVKNVRNVIDSLNDGSFGEKYGNAFQDVVSVDAKESKVDLSRIERGVSDLVDKESKRVVVGDGFLIEYYKNTKRIIRKS